MRQHAANRFIRLFAAALAVVAAALLGTSHPDTNPVRAPLDLAAFSLPDGSLPYLCGAGSHEAPAPDEGTHAACLAACLAVGPNWLPIATFTVVAPLAAYERMVPLAVAPTRPSSVWTTARARAPPIV